MAIIKMHEKWKNFLHKNGAMFEGDTKVTTFGKIERERQIASRGLIMADLSHYGHLSVSGEEAQTYLQGQLTSDVTLINESQSGLGAHCNLKGRVVSLYRVLFHQNRYLLRTSRDNLANAEPLLKKFSVFSKVLIENVSDEWITIGLSGSNAAACLEDAIGQVPKNIHQQSCHEAISVVAIPGLTERFEICGPVSAIIPLWESLDVHAAPVGADAWAVQELLIGLPQVTQTLSGEFLPQSLGLLHWGAVNFEKGCYLGQEVIARLHYKGQVKRTLQLFQGQAKTLPLPGAALFGHEDDSIGVVLQSAWLPDSLLCLLAVVQNANGHSLAHLQGEPRDCLKAVAFQR